MGISFNEVPNNRIPFVYIEFDNSGAIPGLVGQPYEALMIGQKLSSGIKNELEPVQITSENDAIGSFGAGSMLARMAKRYFQNNNGVPLTAVAIDDAAAGTAAAGTVTFSGTATLAGTFAMYVGGQRVQVGVSIGDTAAQVATAAAAAVTEVNDMPALAVVNGGTAEQLDITSKHAGTLGNDIDVRFNFLPGESFPAGISQVTVPLSGGAGDPDVQEIIDVIDSNKQYTVIISPYNDASNIGVLELELDSRSNAIRQVEGILYGSVRGSLSSLTTFGNLRNNEYSSYINATGPSPSWEWAAAYAGRAGDSLNLDPARPLQTLELAGLSVPAPSERFTYEENAILLTDGIATHVINGGAIRIQRAITTYQLNEVGSPDASFLDVNTPATLSFLRFSLRNRIQQKYPRHKLASSIGNIGAGQAVITPNILKAEILSIFRDWEEIALVEDFDAFMESLIVERNPTDVNRLDVLLKPDLINQARIFANKIQFIL